MSCHGQIGRMVSTILFSILVSITQEYYRKPLLRVQGGERKKNGNCGRSRYDNLKNFCGVWLLCETSSEQHSQWNIRKTCIQDMPIFNVLFYIKPEIYTAKLLSACFFIIVIHSCVIEDVSYNS